MCKQRPFLVRRSDHPGDEERLAEEAPPWRRCNEHPPYERMSDQWKRPPREEAWPITSTAEEEQSAEEGPLGGGMTNALPKRGDAINGRSTLKEKAWPTSSQGEEDLSAENAPLAKRHDNTPSRKEEQQIEKVLPNRRGMTNRGDNPGEDALQCSLLERGSNK